MKKLLLILLLLTTNAFAETDLSSITDQIIINSMIKRGASEAEIRQEKEEQFKRSQINQMKAQTEELKEVNRHLEDEELDRDYRFINGQTLPVYRLP